MHDCMPYGRNQGQGQGHSREVDRQSPTGLILMKHGVCVCVWYGMVWYCVVWYGMVLYGMVWHVCM